MAKVNKSLLKQWQDGQVMHGPDYNRERDLLVDAYNDTQTQVDNLKSTTTPAISTDMIQSGAITADKIRGGAVTAGKLGPKAVDNSNLGDGSVNTTNIINSAVTDQKLASNSVTNAKIADGAVTTAKIADSAVTAGKINNEAVTAPKIAPSSINVNHLQNSQVTTEKLADGAVTETKIAEQAVTASKLRDGSVTPSKVTKESVTQYTYDQATIDARIAASVSEAIPQEVIDQIREDVDSSVTDLQNRLNNDSTWNATLNPGRSIYNSFKATKFDLSSLKGRTLVNQLGRLGRFAQGISNGFFGSVDVSITDTAGIKSLKVELTSGTSGSGGPVLVLPVHPSEYYVAVGMVRVDSASSMSAGVGIYGANGNMVTDFSTFQPSVLRFTRATTGGDTRVGMLVTGSAGSYALMRDLRVYSISKTEYDALATMAPEDAAAKYPYVDDMKPVRNPYVLRYGKNLLTQFSNWTLTTGSMTIVGPYRVDMSKTTTGFNTVTASADVVPGQTYFFQVTAEVSNLSGTVGNGAYYSMFAYDSQDRIIGTNMAAPPFATNNGLTSLKTTFTAPIGAKYVKVNLSVNSGAFGNFVFRNPMLILGTAPSGDFPIREDSMLALQTDLNANPYTGADADELFEENGQYFKLAKWRGMQLDGSVGYILHGSKQYMKWVNINLPDGPSVLDTYKFTVTAYDGSIIRNVPGSLANGSSPNQADYDPGGKYLYVSISNSDSGWGDKELPQTYTNVAANRVSYVIPPPAGTSVIKVNSVLINNIPYANWSLSGATVTLEVAPTAGSTVTINYVAAYVPTVDEIKAYFMGWKMTILGASVGNTPAYTGTGEKVWVPVLGFNGSNGTNTLPTATSSSAVDSGCTPYQLVYQLSAPVVEPVVSEGMLIFNEGDNQIEVGSGMVVRENAVFAAETPTSGYSYNAVVPGAGQAKYKVKDFLNVYESGRPISGYTKVLRTTHNGAAINLSRYMFNASAAYSVTYLMLDDVLANPIVGSYNTSENAMLRSLTESVQQNTTAVTALMQRKVEKDAPAVWITPTLLNGWTNFSTSYYDASFAKTPDGLVHLRGVIRNGVVGQNIFILPAGFRPSKALILDAISHNNSTYIASAIRVDPDGRVFLDVGSFYHLPLESVTPFLAEQ